MLIKHSKYFGGNNSSANKEICFDKKIPFEIIKMLVEYINSDQEDALKPTLDNIEQLFGAAEFLKMDGVIKILMAFLRSDFATQDIKKIKKRALLVYLRLNSTYKRYAKLKEYGEEIKKTFKSEGFDDWNATLCPKFFIALNFNRIMDEVHVLDLQFEDLLSILSSSDLIISEADVLTTIKMWIYYDFEARKDCFSSLLTSVRFNKSLDVS